MTGAGADDDRIVIGADDLDSDESSPPVPPPAVQPPTVQPPTAPLPSQSIGGPPGPAPTQGLPGLSPSAPPLNLQSGPTPKSSPLATLGANTIVSGLVAGGLGSLLGFLLAENLKNPGDNAGFQSPNELRIDSGIWVALFGLGLGAMLLAWDGITSGAAEKALRDAAVGAAVGAVAGFIGGFIAQWLYEMLLERPFDSTSEFENRVRLARMLAWALFGGLLGIALGLRGGGKKVAHGLIGGVVGGAVGGLAFQELASMTNDVGEPVLSESVSRLLGLSAAGVGVAVAIGIVERLLRSSWIKIVGGPMTGKEFILYGERTVIGASPKCDIVLVKDRAVAVQHAVIDRVGRQGATLQAVGLVTVNGAPVQHKVLGTGDQVQIGMTTMAYEERATS